MSIASYSELKTAVTNWLNRDDLTVYIPDFITLGEAMIYRQLRINAMETALNVTISSGVAAAPSDYVELKHAYLDGAPTKWLKRADPRFIYEKYPVRSSDSRPAFIAKEGSNFIFGPYPDSNYTIKGIYYAKLEALSDSNTTNWFTANAPDLLLYASLMSAEPFLKNDQRLVVWGGLYGGIKDDIQREENNEQFSGGGLSMSVE